MFDYAVWDENDKQVQIPQIFSSMPPDIQEALRDSRFTLLSFIQQARASVIIHVSQAHPPISNWMPVRFMMLTFSLSVSAKLTLPATGLFLMRVWGRVWGASEFKLLLRWLISLRDQSSSHDNSHHVIDEFAGSCVCRFFPTPSDQYYPSQHSEGGNRKQLRRFLRDHQNVRVFDTALHQMHTSKHCHPINLHLAIDMLFLCWKS